MTQLNIRDDDKYDLVLVNPFKHDLLHKKQCRTLLTAMH